VRAALRNDPDALARLPGFLPGLDEPYRTVADELLRLRALGGFVDANVLGAALERRPLTRVNPRGQRETLQAGQVLALIDGGPIAPGKVDAYLRLLQEERDKKRETERRALVQGAVQTYRGNLLRLAEEILRLAKDRPDAGGPLLEQYPSELLELIP